jgi:hypothetical protein
MTIKNLRRADDIDVSNVSDLPTGWEKTHEERRREIRDGIGYYIKTYESEHFLINIDTDMLNTNETFHHVSLFKVKRGEDGERLTSIGAGVFYVVGVEDGRQALRDGEKDSYFDDNAKAHKEAEQAALQVAINLMKEVNSGKYKEKRYDS